MDNIFLPKRNIFSLDIWVKWILFIIVIATWFLYTKNNISQSQINKAILQNPIQLLHMGDRQTIKLGNRAFEVEPVGNISLWGVVTAIDGKSGIEENQFFSVCMMWGENIALYKSKSYKCWHSNGQCVIKVNPKQKNRFKLSNFSNNHILLPTETLVNQASALNVGDQIKISGQLVNLRNPGEANWIKSSLHRHDVGDGACEIIMPDSIEIIGRQAMSLSIWWHIAFFTTLLLVLFYQRIASWIEERLG